MNDDNTKYKRQSLQYNPKDLTFVDWCLNMHMLLYVLEKDAAQLGQLQNKVKSFSFHEMGDDTTKQVVCVLELDKNEQ
jgi:hypothetical protein